MTIVDLATVRAARIRRGLRKEFILSFKNKLIRASQQEFNETKYKLAQALRAEPTSQVLRVKWELLCELEGDR